MTSLIFFRTQGARRVFVCLATCLVYFVILRLLTIPALNFVDTHFPGTFFYHMEADERGGPLDGAPIVLGMIEFNYAVFAALFIPAVIWGNLPKIIIPLIGVATVPLSLLIMAVTS